MGQKNEDPAKTPLKEGGNRVQSMGEKARLVIEQKTEKAQATKKHGLKHSGIHIIRNSMGGA